MKNRIINSVFPALVALASACGLSVLSTAAAEESDPRLAVEEIVVTAQKRESTLIDTPMSINVMTGDQLEERGIDSTLDLSYAVPSFSVQERRKGRQLYTIRGIGNIFGSSSLVGVYLDDVDVTATGQRAYQVDLSLYDLERVEVLRGPQGTLYGAGSAGGTIRFITKKPNLQEVEGKVEVSAFDTHEGDLSYRLRGAVNLPIAQDVFALRATLNYSDDGGWIDRPAAGQDDANDSDLVNVRLSGLWQVNPDLQALGTVIYHRNDTGASNVANQSLKNSEQTAFLDPAGFDTSSEIENDFFGLTITYDFDFATLTSATGQLETSNSLSDLRLFPFGPPRPPFLGFERREIEESEIFTQELRLNSNGEGDIDWVAGFFYREAEYQSRGEGLALAGIYHPVLGLIYLPSPRIPPPSSSQNEAWAAFANVDYRINDRLTIGAGVRYFEDQRESFDVVTHNPANDLEGDFDDLSPRVYASYAINDDINIYASYAQGFRSGGFNSAGLVALGESPTYDVESIDSFEVGTKMSLLDDSLYAEIALFYTDYTDAQGVVINFEILQLVTKNLGEAEVQGIDVSLLWNVSDNLTLGFNGNYTDHEYTKVPVGGAQLVGDPIDLVPDYNYSFTADYSFDWWDSRPGHFRLAYNEQSSFVFINRNSSLIYPVDESDDISHLNASLGMQIGDAMIELFGRNLTDDHGTITPDKHAFRETQYRRRSIGIRARYEF